MARKKSYTDIKWNNTHGENSINITGTNILEKISSNTLLTTLVNYPIKDIYSQYCEVKLLNDGGGGTSWALSLVPQNIGHNVAPGIGPEGAEGYAFWISNIWYQNKSHATHAKAMKRMTL
jgi:hypothetical protein